MKTLFHYLAGALICCLALTVMPSNGAESEEGVINIDPPASSLVSLDAGKIKDVDSIQVAQKEYIAEKFKGYDVCFMMYLKDGEGRFIDMYVLEDSDGKKAFASFDMGAIYQKLKKKNKATREQIEALERKH